MKNPAKIDKLLQQLVKNSPLGAAVFDDTYHLLQVNPSFCEIIAYAEQELNNFTLITIMYPDDVDETIKLFKQLFNSAQPEPLVA